jgi:hypothetical protein
MAALSASADLFSNQDALEKTNAEAEVACEALPSTMREKREELEAKREDVRKRSGKAVEDRTDEVIMATEKWEEGKVMLEREGGMAMAYELGRRVERMSDGRRL